MTGSGELSFVSHHVVSGGCGLALPATARLLQYLAIMAPEKSSSRRVPTGASSHGRLRRCIRQQSSSGDDRSIRLVHGAASRATDRFRGCSLVAVRIYSPDSVPARIWPEVVTFALLVAAEPLVS